MFRIAVMCRVLGVARAGYYFWVEQPLSDRALEDLRILKLIRDSYGASHGVYGYRRIHLSGMPSPVSLFNAFIIA